MSNSKVKVAVRVRPRNEREEGLNSECVVQVSDNQITLLPPFSCKERERKKPHSFTFDNCFWTEDKHDPGQEDVFKHLGDGVLQNIWLGYNVCIFAYGQTGSGKTFSMMGTDDQPGIMPRLCSALFKKESSDSETFRIEASYLEIYNEEVRDLLRSAKKQKKLRVREDRLLGPYVEDLSCHAVQSYEEIKLLLDQGNKQRAIAETKMNEQSSRSHAILTLTVAQTCNDSKSGALRELVSKVSLVDLAGSERSYKSGAQGSQLKETSNINKSLSTLGLVINSLAEISEKKRKSQYVNYRDSVLTRLLETSLGGNSKTVMLATVSPAADNYQETLSTLRYADSAKRIVNQAVVNEDVKSKAIEELQQAIKRLREQLTTTEQEKEAEVQDLKSQLEEKENLLKDLKTSWEEKLKRTEIATQEWQKNLENMGASLNTQDVVFSNDSYLIQQGKQLIIHNINATTKIGSGPSQDIQISDAEAEHCVIRKTEDGEVFLTPVDNCQTYVNSCLSKTMTKLWHGDKIQIGSNVFILHLPSCPKPEHMKTHNSTEAEAQTYDDLNTEDDKLSILPKRDTWNSSMIEDGKAKTDSAIPTNYTTTEGFSQTIPSSNDDFTSSKNKQISHISTQICNESYSHLINRNVNTARNSQSEYLGIAAGTQVQDSTVQCSPQYGDVTFSNQCYLIQRDKQLIIHNINATTKIGSGPSQDIQISDAEAEHCVIRKTEDGEVFLTPVDNCQTFVNSCLSKTMTQLWHGDKIQIGSNVFSLHLPSSPKPEHMKTDDSTEAEAQTYDALNKEDDELSILPKRDSWNSSMIEDEKAKTDSAISTNYTTEGVSQTIPSSNDDFGSSKNKKISHISSQICNASYSHLINMNVKTARNTKSEYLGIAAGTQVQDPTVQCSPQYGDVTFSNQCYLIQQDKQLIIHNIKATTKIGFGPIQDIQISGAEAECEHCVIRKTEDGEVFLIPVDNCQIYVNSCLSKTMTQLWHGDKIQLGSNEFRLHLPSSPKPEHMKTDDSTEAEAQTYDDLNTEDDMLSILPKRDSWNSSMIEDEKAKMDSAIPIKYMTTEGFSQTIPSSNGDFTSSKNKQISHISTQICNEPYRHLINRNVNTSRNTQSEYLGIAAGTQVQDSTVQCSPQYGEASSQTSEILKSSNRLQNTSDLEHHATLSRDTMSVEESGERLTIIFYQDRNIDVSPLVTLLLQSPYFGRVSLCPCTSSFEAQWKSRVDEYSTIFLCLSPETPHTDLSDLEEFLEYCRKKQNPGSIKVVIMDVEDINSERKITGWWMTKKYSDYELLALSKAEMKLLSDHNIDLLSPERRMANKVRHMHRILQEAAEKSRIQKWQFVGKVASSLLYKPKITSWSILYHLGVTSSSVESDDSWLTELLHSDDFKDHFSEVINDRSRKLSSESCPFGILYYTNKNGQKNEIDATDVEMIQQYSSVGMNNMIIVMDGLEDSSDQEKIRILRHQPHMEELRHNLFLISHQESSSKYQNLLSSLLRINKPQQPADVPKTEPHIDLVKAKAYVMSYLGDKFPRNILGNISWSQLISSRSVLGIFSRASKEDYSWLEEMLRPRFTVKSFYISNNRFRQFMEEVSQCWVGILYHSKNRGRNNVTDVTNSLYDNELEHMSTILGKKKVWVVIDDLDDNSEEVKKEILHNQPKIRNLAKDLYLIKHGTSEQKVRDLEQNKNLFTSPIFH